MEIIENMIDNPNNHRIDFQLIYKLIKILKKSLVIKLIKSIKIYKVEEQTYNIKFKSQSDCILTEIPLLDVKLSFIKLIEEGNSVNKSIDIIEYQYSLNSYSQYQYVTGKLFSHIIIHT